MLSTLFTSVALSCLVATRLVYTGRPTLCGRCLAVTSNYPCKFRGDLKVHDSRDIADVDLRVGCDLSALKSQEYIKLQTFKWSKLQVVLKYLWEKS